MDFLARKIIFVPNTKILPGEWIAELDQLYRYLSGSLSGQMHLKNKLVNSVLILQNTTAEKDIILFKRDGIDKVRILETNQLKSEVTDIVPIDVQSTTVVPNLNADLLGGVNSSSIITINNVHTEYLVPLWLENVQVTTVKNFVYIVPAGSNMVMTRIDVRGIGYLGDTVGLVSVSVRKNGVAQLNGSIGPGDSLGNNFNVALAENDIFSITADAIDNFPGLEYIHASIKIKEDLTT